MLKKASLGVTEKDAREQLQVVINKI